jgi:F0F1-type ATP synthase assembly protein I
MGDPGSDMGQRPQPPRSRSRPLGLGGAASGGIEFTVAILVGLFVGRWLDRRMGTEPWLLILGVFVGAAAGFYNLYRALTTAQRASRSQDRDDQTPTDQR